MRQSCKRAGLFFLLLFFYSKAFIQAQPGTIHNDSFWNTVDGQPIRSQGGGIFRFPDPQSGQLKYYWYGVYYEEADTYRQDPTVTLPNATFKAVTCYSSTDLVNWKFEADVLTKDEVIRQNRRTWVGRLGVAYIQERKQYALFVQHDNEVLVALSSFPAGEFKWHQKINMQSMIGTSNTGDQTVFTDEDSGKSYLIYSYGKGRNRIYVSEIGVKDGKVGLLDCTKVFQGESREGNCLFKYKGKYYMCASNIYGWDASYTYYLVADNIRGPYLPENNMQVMKGCTDDYAHVSQTGFFINVKGTKQETVIYCGDRWANFAGNGLGYNQWVPLSFEGTVPYFNSLSDWQLDARTGEWKAAKENNYVRNGSFEADRKYLPSAVKPVQQELTGWTTTVLKGNPVSQDSVNSPVLNYYNSAADRKIVTGEKSLQLTDKIPFSRKITQTIGSTAFVPLEDGSYTLTAQLQNSGLFQQLELFAVSKGKRYSTKIEGENKNWRSIRLEKIKVKGGKLEIGLMADAEAGAVCLLDDVELRRSN